MNSLKSQDMRIRSLALGALASGRAAAQDKVRWAYFQVRLVAAYFVALDEVFRAGHQPEMTKLMADAERPR